MALPRLSVDQRFDSQFVRNGDDECWPWTGSAKNQFGHGAFKLGPRASKVVYAHRFAWERANQTAIPPGMVVRHSCDNPRCVNPRHLLLGTQAENVADKVARGRHLFGERVPNAKLTEESVRSIKKLAGRRSEEVAELFSVSRQSIADIRAGRTWRHV